MVWTSTAGMHVNTNSTQFTMQVKLSSGSQLPVATINDGSGPWGTPLPSDGISCPCVDAFAPGLEAGIAALRTEEGKLLENLKTAAHNGDDVSMRLLAKSLVGLRGRMNKLQANVARLQSISATLEVRRGGARQGGKGAKECPLLRLKVEQSPGNLEGSAQQQLASIHTASQ